MNWRHESIHDGEEVDNDEHVEEKSHQLLQHHQKHQEKKPYCLSVLEQAGKCLGLQKGLQIEREELRRIQNHLQEEIKEVAAAVRLALQIDSGILSK